jgi:D-glycerate 3-kinase
LRARAQLGISAPQGCGKSTLVEQLEQLFAWLGVRAASVSIDDFYLTHSDQSALAAAHPDNRLLQLRGNAGSHDLQLGTDTLRQLRGLTRAGDSAAVPRWGARGAWVGLMEGRCGGMAQGGAEFTVVLVGGVC